MSKHTPGPWQVSGVRHKWRDSASPQILDSHAVGPDNDAVCLVFYTPKHHTEQLTNAKLIAAAPDLLAAAKRAMGATFTQRYDFLDDLAAAIAKAEGETPAPHTCSV